LEVESRDNDTWRENEEEQARVSKENSQKEEMQLIEQGMRHTKTII